MELFLNYYPFFLNGLGLTLFISIISVLIGSVIGVIISLMKLSSNSILKGFAHSYVAFFRGTPLLVQVYIIFYGLPIDIPKLPAGILALSINSGAYVAEIIRGGIQSVDKGQSEAARSLGMSNKQTFRHIVLPQAIRTVLPSLGNEFVVIIKESAIVSVIGVHELMFNTQTVRGSTYEAFIPLLIAAIFYFIITFTISKSLEILERRLNNYDSSYKSAQKI